MTEKLPPRWRHDKWLATAIWLALLVAVLVTSNYGLGAIVTSNFLATITYWQAQFGIQSDASDFTFKLTLLVSVIFAVVAIANIVLAWLRLAHMGRRLIISFAWLEEQGEDSTIFSDLLEYDTIVDEEDEEPDYPDLDLVEGSYVSSVVRYLALAWAFLLGSSPAVYLITLLTK